VVVQDGPNTLVFINISDKIYHVAVKATQTGKGLFATSLRITHEKEVERVKRVGKVVRE